MIFIKDTYDSWIRHNYTPIVAMLKARYILNEDALHDAMISLYDSVKNYESVTPDELSTLFQKEYRRHDKKAFSAIRQHLHFEPRILDLIVSDNAEAECDGEYNDNSLEVKKACSKLKRIAQRLRIVADFELLRLYTAYNLTLKDLSVYTGVPPGTLYGKLQRTKQTLRANYS